MQCKNCSKEFIVTDRDRRFYNSINVPEPDLCPGCRRQRLLCWRNQRTLYSRKCDKTGKNIISIFTPDAKYVVYDRDYWWSDDWDPGDYGMEFDFSRPFFEQFNELLHQVPLVGIFNGKSTNSQYCNHVGEMKNCYLVFASWECEDSFYGDLLHKTKDSSDCLECNKLEKCYELVSCTGCFNVQYSLQSENCLDSRFLYDCRGCQNCVACTNLRNKQYHIFNKPYSKEAYEEEIEKLKLNTRSGTAEVRQRFEKIKLQAIHRFALLIQCQNSTGDDLIGAKDCVSCFGMRTAESCSYCINGAQHIKDTYEGYGVGDRSERGYFLIDTGVGGTDNLFCGIVWSCSYTYYCYNCHSSTELFGCSGLRNKEYCILNKEYPKEEYFKLKEKIIEHMKNTGEWGSFMPPAISLFGINETIAYEYTPISKEEAMKFGFNWQDSISGTFGKETAKPQDIPESISGVEDKILDQVLACASCGKNYKIIKQELVFYKEMDLPLPLECPDCRYQARLKLRNPHSLWHRQCSCELAGHKHQGRCTVEFETTYAPDRPEKVYCEDCYQKEIY